MLSLFATFSLNLVLVVPLSSSQAVTLVSVLVVALPMTELTRSVSNLHSPLPVCCSLPRFIVFFEMTIVI
jgi:hypothetical protein